jgi:phasin family protein
MDVNQANQTTQIVHETAEKIFGATREQAETATRTMLKTSEEMQKLSKENFDACIQASTIVARGVQELSRAWTAYLQESLERSAAATKALMAARSLPEIVSLQSDWAKTSYDKFIAEATRLSEQAVKVTAEAMEPINTRLSVSAEKLKMQMPLAA